MTAIRAALLAALMGFAEAQSVRVVDAGSGGPIAGAFVTANGVVAETDANGFAKVEGGPHERVFVRAPGYGRKEFALRAREAREVHLETFEPKALFLTSLGLSSSVLREPAISLLEQTELNALVIDVKGDRGWIGYPSSVPLASEIGAVRSALSKNAAHIERLRSMGVYLIARIVVFKDSPLALARPELAVKTAAGAIWRDRENLAWTDPLRQAVWDYNIDIAVEAAQIGFDEIQFDYVRFPDARGVVLSEPNTRANRIGAVQGFLREARRRLAPYNVFLAADIFGYVLWNPGDTEIGQQLEDLVKDVDYLCPMLYPSGFKYGIPSYRTAVAYPYEIVRYSLEKAWARTQLNRRRLRPWIQAFRDYAFDRRAFGPDQVKAQIRAAEEFGSNGWMVWNPRNVYSRDAFQVE